MLLYDCPWILVNHGSSEDCISFGGVRANEGMADRGYSNDPRFDGLEIALKADRIGKADYIGRVRAS